MTQSSAPKPPRIAPTVTVEAVLAPVIAALFSTAAWNFLVAATSDLPTVNFFAVFGFFIVIAQVAGVVGGELGYGLSRRELAEQEKYGRAAAEYLDALEEGVTQFEGKAGGQG